MTLEEFVEFVTESTGFCVLGAAVDTEHKLVTVIFDTETDGETQVWEPND